MSRILTGLMVVAVLSVAGCRATPIYNATDIGYAGSAASSARVLTLEDYRDAIVRAGAKRGWTFEEIAPGHLVGNVAVRGKHFATVDVTFDASAFSITYNSSRNLNYSAERSEIHPNYNAWVSNLQKDIQTEVTVLRAS